MNVPPPDTAATAPAPTAEKPVIYEVQAQYALIEASRKAGLEARASGGGDPMALEALAGTPLVISSELGEVIFPMPTIGSMLAQGKAFSAYSLAGAVPHLLLTAAAFLDPRGLYTLATGPLPVEAMDLRCFELGCSLPLSTLPRINAWVAKQLAFLGGDEEEPSGPLAQSPPADPAAG